ncbi:hypothetical protein [Allosphingosinicella humi]
MTANNPAIGPLPTTRQLNRATALAAAAAAAILVTTVLPAEYGIDPTGIGGALGLTAMGHAKQAEAAPASAMATPAIAATTATAAPTATDATGAATQSGKVTLTLQPNEGTEVKASMKGGEEFAYSWSTDGAKVNFELHGERFDATADEYTSYEKGTSTGASGTFRAPFDGTHGWYWRNRTGEPITITVTANGQFQKFEQKK